MNAPVIPIQVLRDPARSPRKNSGERPVDPQAAADIGDLLAGWPIRRDLLIECLHAINDRYGQLRTDHLAALAQRLKLSQAEVFEVASFYHHFEVVRPRPDGSYADPAALTVRWARTCKES